MNINALKLGFANYLQSLSEISNKDYKNIDSDISIFMYSTAPAAAFDTANVKPEALRLGIITP